MIFKKRIATEIIDCLIRLDYSNSRKKINKELFNYQDGKIYAYSYTLQLLGYCTIGSGKFPGHIRLKKKGIFYSFSPYIKSNIFIKEKIFRKALKGIHKKDEKLYMDIIKYRGQKGI